MTKQKDAWAQLNELSLRIGLMVKQYNDLARSESYDSRVAFGYCEEYVGDDKSDPREIEFVEPAENDSWADSGCEWESSSTNC